MPNMKTHYQELQSEKYCYTIKMKNKTITSISSGTYYSVLKLAALSVDPYTRSAAGLALGFALVLKYGDENYAALYIGIGVLLGSILQLAEVAKGGRLIRNQSSVPVYIFGEKGNLSVLESGQVPSGDIIGFTCKGLNGVFKLSDGVYAKINANNAIQYARGLGRLINQSIRSGGFKTKQWVDQQSDLRWKELYDRSI